MRVLLVVPKMFTQKELAGINSSIPDDYKEKSEEFWNYVIDKLKTQKEIHKVYYDSLIKEDKDEALKFIKDDNEQCYILVEKYVEGGANPQATEDSLLLQETDSWIRMLDKKGDSVTQELLMQSIEDRNKYVAKRIDETLMKDETGILFMGSSRRINEYLPSDIKVIKIQPFDPSDYLNSWMVTLELKAREK